MANSVTTTNARETFASAHAGAITLPAITQIAFGDGGHDPTTGDPIQPSASATTVLGEFLKKAVDSISATSTITTIMGSLTSSEGNGYEVSACGLYDSAGTLVAMKTFYPKTKDSDTVIEIEWNEEF